MTTWEGHGGTDHAEAVWDGQRFAVAHHSATTELARVLIAAGCPDQPWQAYTPGRTPSFKGNSLAAWAGLVLEGGRFRPHGRRHRQGPPQQGGAEHAGRLAEPVPVVAPHARAEAADALLTKLETYNG